MTALGVAALLPLALLQSGCGSSESDSTADPASTVPGKAFTASLEAHQNTLTYNVINLTTWANRLRRMIAAGNREEAVDSYLHARGWLGRIEPVLAAMPAVSDPLLDPAGDEGFPRIEQGLRDGRLQQLQPIMKRFHLRMESLRVRVEHAGLEPAQLPGLAIESLRTLELTNSEGAVFPNLQATEAAARLEGVRGLFLALSPTVEDDPALRDEIKQAFDEIFRTLKEMEGRSGDSQRSELGAPATSFPELERDPDRWQRSLSREVDELIRLLAEASRL